MLRHTLIGTCAVGALSVTAMSWSATIEPVSQNRNVFGDSNANNQINSTQDIDSIEAEGFKPFRDTLITDATVPNASGIVVASQTSLIGACDLIAQGIYTATAVGEVENAVAFSIGASVFDVTFTLNQAESFVLSGSAASDSIATNVRIQMFQNGALIINELISDASADIHFDGVLMPGEYRVFFQAFGSAFSLDPGKDASSGNFDLTFSICADSIADLNADGAVNGSDLLILLNNWGGCPDQPAGCAGDLDDNGQVAGNDLLFLLSQWG